MPPAVDWLVQDLQRRGVEWASVLPGHGLDPLVEMASRAGLRLLETRTEQAASYAAEACGRLTRKPGLCMVSSGIGHVNALSGVTMAWFDSTPMILLSGAGATTTAGLGHYQDMDQPGVAAPVTVWSRLVDRPERMREMLDEAFEHAESGPVHLTLPLDVQTAEVSAERMLRPVARTRPERSEDDVDRVVRLIRASTKPVIVAGSGMYYEGTFPVLLEFAERYAIPVVQPVWDRGIVDYPSEVFAGFAGMSSGGPKILDEADCILMAGAIPDYRVGYLQPPAVREDAEIAYVRRGWPDLALTDSHYLGGSNRDWLNEVRRRVAEFRKVVETAAAGQARGGMHACHIIDAIRGVLTDRTCLLVDGGAISAWAHHLLFDRYPGSWLTNGRSGAIGWGLGAAMGARMSLPDNPIILLSGDGAFTFTLAEIETAVRRKLPFVAIVADDQGWGLLGSALGPIRFADAAHAFGARGVVARTPDALVKELRRALDEASVTVIHVPIVGGRPA